jgi:hypothetical protein
MIPIPRDFQEFLRLLNDQGIEFLSQDMAEVDALSKRKP